jgi:hypothetical protein
MHLSPSTRKRDLVHRQLHQVDAATLLSLQSFDRQRVGDRSWIKPWPVVRHDNGHSLSQLTLTTNLNEFVSAHPTAVNDCITQSRLKRQFNGALATRNAMRSFD